MYQVYYRLLGNILEDRKGFAYKISDSEFTNNPNHGWMVHEINLNLQIFGYRDL